MGLLIGCWATRPDKEILYDCHDFSLDLHKEGGLGPRWVLLAGLGGSNGLNVEPENTKPVKT